jgi:hypothetical protein
MPCTCGSPHCPAATDKPANPIVINVIAETATVEGTSDKPGYLPGYGAVPAATMQQLAKHASLRPAPTAKDLLAEPNYRPSAALTRFIRCRDLTCRLRPTRHRLRPCPAPTGPLTCRTTSRTAESTTNNYVRTCRTWLRRNILLQARRQDYPRYLPTRRFNRCA